MGRFVYTLILVCLLPFILMRLWWRGKANPAYRSRVSERLGYYALNPEKERVWIHAVSVGEVNAAIPLIKRLLTDFPKYDILVTTMTPTGADQVKKQLADLVTHRFVPYDIPCLINRALEQSKPSALIIMETEIWPNWIHAADNRNIPIIYLSLRLSEKSFRGYKKIRSLLTPALKRVKAIAAQSESDAQRIITLGARSQSVTVSGNIKYDASLPEHVPLKGEKLRHQLGASRLIWIAASTHIGEDEQVLKAHSIILKSFPDALLVIVPRHPERFDRVFELCQQQFVCQRRTDAAGSLSSAQVYLGDTMGELLELYAASDICFVGGSLVAHGGQNILEPWLIGKPVIVGPHTFNFARIIEQALDENALIQIKSADELASAIRQLADNEQHAKQLCDNANQLLKRNKGALDASLKILQAHLNN